MPFDLSDALASDWDSVFDEVEEVTLEREGSNVATGIDALVFEERMARIGGLMDGEVKTRSFLLRKSSLGANEPAQDDVIIRNDGLATEERFTIVSFEYSDLEPDYDCVCTKEI